MYEYISTKKINSVLLSTNIVPSQMFHVMKYIECNGMFFPQFYGMFLGFIKVTIIKDITSEV
jgi:hypothetical protein